VAALFRDFSYHYKVSVYQIQFDGRQAPCQIGTTIVVVVVVIVVVVVGVGVVVSVIIVVVVVVSVIVVALVVF
jgi:hypothetical protein